MSQIPARVYYTTGGITSARLLYTLVQHALAAIIWRRLGWGMPSLWDTDASTPGQLVLPYLVDWQNLVELDQVNKPVWIEIMTPIA